VIVFDTIDGLPVHALVLHATVALLPLMAIATVAVAVVPRWRRGGGVVVALLDALMVPLVFVTIQSGEALQERLSTATGSTVAEEHGERGALLIYFAIALFVAGLIVAFFSRNGGFGSLVAIVAAVVIGAGTIGWTYYTGDSGARAVWEDVVANTPAPSGG
jgi:hypothetical protein